MFRVPLLIGIVLALTFFGGIYSAQWALDATRGFGGLQVNNWVAYPRIQTEEADPYARAHRANDGKILLGRAEGLVFRAVADNEGRPFQSNCDYHLKGRVPPALFWTLRTLHPDNEPIVRPSGWPSATNARNALRDGFGNLNIELSRVAKSGNWLSLDNRSERKEGFELQLTLIDTPISNVSGIRELQMPVITRVGCV